MMVDTNLETLTKTVANLNDRLSVLERANTQKLNGLDMNPEALWTPKHISKYSGLSYGYVRQHLVKQAGFPDSLPVSKGSKRKRLFYLAGEVVQYFNHK